MRLADFAGLWTVKREIEDRRAGRPGSFTGLARLTPAEGGLAYVEEGRLSLGSGPAVAASRRYLWREAATAIEVHFEDGRLFHRFDPAEGSPSAFHDCPPDAYRVRYDFARWPLWRSEWRVVGPRKDYAMVTAYRRAS
jgi:hypothetical protein